MNAMKDEAVILIAEDDAGHAFLIRKNLTRHGIENPVIHFENGQEVLDFFLESSLEGKQAYDRDVAYVLLLDIRMPKVDGIEVLRQLRLMEHLREIPVIMVTTTEDPVDVEKCVSLGCRGYVTKPVDYMELIKALEEVGVS